MSTYEKLSISLSPAASAALEPRVGPHGRSPAIARMIERYAEICRRSRPQLSRAEWSAICDSLGGVLHEPAPMVAALAIGVADSIRLDGLAAQWSIDGDRLVAELSALDYAGQLAVVDLVERYWASGDSPAGFFDGEGIE